MYVGEKSTTKLECMWTIRNSVCWLQNVYVCYIKNYICNNGATTLMAAPIAYVKSNLFNIIFYSDTWNIVSFYFDVNVFSKSKKIT